jgi:hypothetical protein
MTYAYGALDRVSVGASAGTVAGYGGAVVGFTFATLVFGGLTLRRRTA